LKDSELILNHDGSIYHLALLPENISPTVILVGDQDRVSLVSKHFDSIEFKKQKREFITNTGTIKGKSITVISTGIGTDNIDIVLNELDALVNVDLKSRAIKKDHTTLKIIRIGTSGSIHPDIHNNDLVVSRYAIGTDSLGQYYGVHQSQHDLLPPWSYFVKGANFDLSLFEGPLKEGITLTCPGFYAAQGRTLRLHPEYKLPVDKLSEIYLHGLPITNIEMETAGIYLLCEKMGHEAISFNIILAERLTGRFSNNKEILDQYIRRILNWIVLS
jgi:uridine phosphorylase